MSPFRQRKSDLTALEPAQRRRDPAPSTGPEAIRRLIDMTFADRTTEARSQIARSVTSRLAERIHACLDRLIEQGPTAGRPELRRLLQAEPPDADPFPAVAAQLDSATCLALLSSQDPGLVSDSLRTGQGAALHEAALEAMLSRSTLLRLDRACMAHGSTRILVLLERLAPSDLHRLEWRQSLSLSVPSAPPPAPRHDEADEPAVMAALQRGDNPRAVALLAAAALVPVASVQAAIALRSRRGLVSLAWKAGFSMRAAILLQSQLAGIAPDSVLIAHADGSCPLTRNEMVWQISFLSRKLA